MSSTLLRNAVFGYSEDIGDFLVEMTSLSTTGRCYHIGMAMGDVWLGRSFPFTAGLYGHALTVVSAVWVPYRTT
ncbi:hypothetical protein BDV38DRAFT_236540 [Aspergillus pseudotamarii]|uniref:Uncharacterized protein n=1 Tax=Aspergillus pseudotamarii TaxID=132259 RepID=A0A5N6T6F9_ASPPS|nr:uncharacterized protein BDV38DRAFT_236540 [Aspergillus pseudotamarii]KAE8141846.1 hypothetical protein BDV38DRAFT_236540 [Aspergillus pseudotamarii]